MALPRACLVQNALSSELNKLIVEPKLATTLFGQLSKRGKLQLALHVFRTLQLARAETNVFHYGALLSACSRSEKVGWQVAVELFQEMQDQSLQQSPICCNAIISACDKGGQWQLALAFLHGMKPDGIEVNEFCYNSAISACARSSQWQTSISLLDELTSISMFPTEKNYNSAISACERGGEWELALSLLQEMMHMRLSYTAWSYSAAISACECASQWESALQFLQNMSSARCLPDTVSCTAAMNACAKAARWEASLWLLAEMDFVFDQVDQYCFNAAMSACEKSGRWELAACVFEIMFSQKASPGLITYNAAIGSCKRSGQWERALLLLQETCACALLPDVITYNCAIGACNAASKWEIALKLFEILGSNTSVPDSPADSIPPDGSTFTELAGALEKSKEWRKSLQILSIALSKNIVPDGTFSGSVASAVADACGEGAAMSLLREMLKKWHEARAASDIHLDDLANTSDSLLPGTAVDGVDGVEVLAKRPGIVVLMKPSGLSTESMMEMVFGRLWSTRVQTVSRLDYPTSGVIPVAMGPEGSIPCQWLQAQFSAKLVKKEYLCLAEGPFLGEIGETGSISKPLRSFGTDSLRTEVHPEGRFAYTGYEILERFRAGDLGEIKLLLAKPATGRTHQIRVHFASIGQPLVGDETYGAQQSLLASCPRLFLHCQRSSQTQTQNTNTPIHIWIDQEEGEEEEEGEIEEKQERQEHEKEEEEEEKDSVTDARTKKNKKKKTKKKKIKKKKKKNP
eukprot:s893_g9.t1